MRRAIAILVGLALVGSILAFAPPALSRRAGGAADAIAAELDMAYMQRVIEDLTAIGSSPIGFRTAGTPEDLETAEYVVAEMEDIGLEDAAIETVPVDMWRFLDASLSITSTEGTWTFPAASHGGVPPTPEDGLTGDIVYVGKGRAMDYEDLAARGVSVAGKLVLADWDADEVWTNHIAMEAIDRGALGTIVTALPGGDYYQARDALGGFDSVCDPTLCGTFITISQEDALTILGLLSEGPVRGTMILDVEMAYNVDGYNTIGSIRGRLWPDQAILFNAHHDAWFRGAIDDTSGVAMVLAIAKAVIASGYEPERTLVFMTSTGEEWGVEDSYYDWLIGSYYRITRDHPEWQSEAVALLNVEGSGFAGDPMQVNVNQEYRSFLMRMLGRLNRLTPFGFQVFETYSWNELWTYAAAGVPGFTFSSSGDVFSNTIYHTDQDTIEAIDFGYLGLTTEFVARVFVELDRMAILPYDFGRRLGNLEDRLDYATMADLLGREDAAIAALRESMEDLQDAVAAYDANKGRVPAEAQLEFQTHAREAVRSGLTAFTALNVWDFTVYPHEQLEMDAVHLGMAIADLRAGEINSGLRHLEWWVGQSWYIPRLGRTPFTEEMDHHDVSKVTGEVDLGGPKAITWGGQGQLPPYWNLWDAYMGIAEKASTGDSNLGPEIQVLMDTRRAAIDEYRSRLVILAEAIGAVATHLNAAVASMD